MPRRAECLVDREVGVRRDLVAEQVRGRVRPSGEIVPAAELDGAELRVLERVPVDVTPGMVRVAPPEHGQRLVVGRADVPEVRRLLGARGPLHDVPELGGPAEHAAVLVHPVVGGAAHRVGRVPGEVLVDRVRRVAGEARADLGHLGPGPRVEARQLRIGLHRRGAQQHAAAGVERVVAADVRARADGANERIDLRLAERVIARAADAAAPPGWKVAVEVEPLDRTRRGDGEPVVVGDRALEHDPVPQRTGRCALRRHGHHQPRIAGVRRPAAVRIGDADRQDPPVTVDVLDVETRPTVAVAPRPGARAGAAHARPIGQHPLGAVGVHPRHDVEGPCAERLHDRRLALAIPRGEPPDDRTGSDTGRELDRVDVGIDPVGRLRVVRAGGCVGDRDEPEIAALVRPAVRLDRHQVRVRGSDGVEPHDQLVVAEVPVELVRHPGDGRGTPQRSGRCGHADPGPRPCSVHSTPCRWRSPSIPRSVAGPAPCCSSSPTVSASPRRARATRSPRPTHPRSTGSRAATSTPSWPHTGPPSGCRPTTTWATARWATTRSAPDVCSRRVRSSSTGPSPPGRSSSPRCGSRRSSRVAAARCTSSACTPTAASTRRTNTSTRCCATPPRTASPAPRCTSSTTVATCRRARHSPTSSRPKPCWRRSTPAATTTRHATSASRRAGAA